MKGFVAEWSQRRISGADLDPSRVVKRRRMTGKGFESVIGDDDRRIVPDVTILPWRPMVCLQLHFGAASGIGSGVLIAPDVILTAAHNLYMLETRAFPDAIVATVGTRNGQAVAESRVTRIDVCPGYTNLGGPGDPSRYRLDYGIARLANDALFKWAGTAVDVASQAPLSDITASGSASVPDKSLAVGLGQVKLPAYLFNTSLAVRKGTNEIDYLPSALWAERLDTGFQRVLAADLAIVLPTDRIQLSAWQKDDVVAEVYVTIEQFDVDASGRGVLVAQWRVLSPGGEKILKAGVSRLTHRSQT